MDVYVSALRIWNYGTEKILSDQVKIYNIHIKFSTWLVVG